MKLLTRLAVLVALFGFPDPAKADEAAVKPAELEKALARAGGNRAELEKALQAVPAEQRTGMAFLIANMPAPDLKALHADFLLENVRLAYEARKQVPWGARIPEAIFLNEILPYANVDEVRHPWRKEFFEMCLPLVKDCKDPAEAAQRLNSTLFKKLQVRYSPQRGKPHQSPKESIAGGTASCTGLSILLSDACRAVAVPARLVGTPNWSDKRGNHTWVEIWDGGWHFTGACEADPRGLDHAWFEADASRAQKDSREHAIYAASFRKTQTTFPLVWALQSKDVSAENVTERYAKPSSQKAGTTRVLIRVWASGRTKRLEVPVTVVDEKEKGRIYQGVTRGEGADTNDLLALELPAGRSYVLKIARFNLVKPFATTNQKQQVVEVEVTAAGGSSQARLSAAQKKEIVQAAAAFFTADKSKQAGWKFDSKLDDLLLTHEAEIRQAVWKAYQAAPIHAAAKEDFDKHQVHFEKHLSPYTIKTVGRRPKRGWPLFIAMHGGGGAPKQVNDSQWKHMQIYYRDQPEAEGYLYLALRAPNDTWNGFYDTYVPPLIINLIRQFLLFGDVDPDRVYLMGYSHGGYGAFYIGPKIPDRFAAVHCSASAPTDGTISPKALRNTQFTFMIGENDNAYGRRQRCEAFNQAIEKLKEQDPTDFPVAMEFKKGFGHGGLPDRDKIKDLYPFKRLSVPRHLSWELTDSAIRHFYWLTLPEPEKGQSIDAVIDDNNIRIKCDKVKELFFYADSRLIDLTKPVRITTNGVTSTFEKVQPLLFMLCQTMQERGDPELAFSCRMGWTAPAR
jgi:predicted peptidase